MKKHVVLLAAALLALSSGCTNIASSRSGQTTVNGEAWYVKTTYFLVLPVGNTVYYCPPPQGRGTPTCFEAKMNEGNVAMTQPAYEKFVPLLRPEGTLIYDQDLVVTEARHEPAGIDKHGLSATDIAFKKLGRKIVANMVMLGYMNTFLSLVTPEALEKAVSQNVPKGTEKLNLDALHEGIDAAREQMESRATSGSSA